MHKMQTTRQSQQIIMTFRQELIKFANDLRIQRQYLFKNMNTYTVHRFSQMITELNQQETWAAQQISINNDDYDIQTIPIDKFMPISQSKFTSFPTNDTVLEYDSSQEKSLPIQQKRRRRRTMATKMQLKKLQKFSAPFKYTPTVSNSSRTLMQINQLQEQQTRQIQAFRVMKTKQYDDRLKKQAQQLQKKKKNLIINLNTQKVIFDYQGKLSKLDKIKQTRFKSLPHLTINSIQTQNNDKKKKKTRKLSTVKSTNEIYDKINVTLRQMQTEKERKNKKNNKNQLSGHTQSDYINQHVKVNPQSHQQIKNAIYVKDHGITIKYQDKEIFYQKDPPPIPSKINRRLSKQQYIQFKADQEKKKIILNSKYKFIQKKKQQQKPLESIVEVQKKKQQPKQKQPNFEKSTLGLIHPQFDKSKVHVYSQKGRYQLIKQLKQKPYLTEETPQQYNNRSSLSNIDRYNLLYLKYNGNPPINVFEKLAKQLKAQNQQIKNGKNYSLLINSNKKKSVNRQLFLMSNTSKR